MHKVLDPREQSDGMLKAWRNMEDLGVYDDLEGQLLRKRKLDAFDVHKDLGDAVTGRALSPCLFN
jgi:hypothetical protein